MAHDVFVSYASKDKPTADAVVAKLEANAIRCWIAPRDITPGVDWGAAIIAAIQQSRLMVLVFSENANQSPQIVREVERAVNRGIPIIPLRVQDVLPASSLEYFLSTPHWLDALTPPLEQHLDYLTQTVRLLLDQGPGAPSVPRRNAPPPPPRKTLTLSPMMLAVGAAVVAVIAAVLALTLLSGGGGASGASSGSSGGAASGADATSVDKAVVGSWQVDLGRSNNYGGLLKGFTWDVTADGHYTANLSFEESGSIDTQSVSGGWNLTNGSPYSPRLTTWQQDGDTAQAFGLVPMQLGGLIASYSTAASQQIFAEREVEWKRTQSGPANSAVGVWTRDATYGGQVWSMTFEVKQGGGYDFRATTKDTGRFFASNGSWNLVSDFGGTAEGKYTSLDAKTLSLPQTRWGDMLWVRN